MEKDRLEKEKTVEMFRSLAANPDAETYWQLGAYEDGAVIGIFLVRRSRSPSRSKLSKQGITGSGWDNAQKHQSPAALERDETPQRLESGNQDIYQTTDCLVHYLLGALSLALYQPLETPNYEVMGL